MERNKLNRCQLCGLDRLVTFDDFAALARITSDCFPYKPGGHLAVCESCGHIQKLAEADWRREIEEIYRRYDMFHQGGGDEQMVLDPIAGGPRRRSELLVDRLGKFVDLSAPGKSFIDIGCGTGALVRAVSQAAPGWALHGLEYDDRQLATLRAISGFRRLYTGDLSSLTERVDYAAMIHVLEHLEQPVDYLRQLREKLTPGGMLFVQVPNAMDNPIDLLIADHLSHFQPETLQLAAGRAAFEIVHFTGEWVPKELSLLMRPGQVNSANVGSGGRAAIQMVREQLDWLAKFVEAARQTANDARNFGLFGTSIAATWLFPFVEDRVRFFVDEDVSRQGKEYLGRPVVGPEKVAADATVFLAMVPRTAGAVKARLRSSAFELAPPPGLERVAG